MYLSASKYVPGYKHNSDHDRAMYRAILSAAGIAGVYEPSLSGNDEGSPSLRVVLNVAYWRKANQIHKWFVDNVQKGKDECQESYCDRAQLEQLLATCKEALANRDKAGELLPPQSGFFFGSTDLDQGYFQDLEQTVKQLEGILNNPTLKECEFVYRSSW